MSDIFTSLKRPREGLAFCVPIGKRPQTGAADDSERRVFLGSVRVDFQQTHAAFCAAESHKEEELRKFCFARCDILKKKISKMLKGTAAIVVTAERVKGDDEHPIVIRCNGTAIGSFSGATAEVIAGGLDAGQLTLQGGEDKVATWSEADFDVYFVPAAGGDAASASEWTRRLRERCDDFEADVRAEQRVCLSGACDCC